MKKFLSILLILALALGALSGCSRRRSAVEAPAEGDFNPDNGPGYTITDGSGAAGGADMGDEQPTPEPVETLPPEDIALEMRMAGIADDALAANASSAETSEGTPDGSDGAADSGAAVSGSADDDIVLGTYDEAADNAQQRAASAIIDTSAYQYSAVLDENIDYTFNYPSHWENVPGIYTVCFREPVDDGSFPARVAITRKRLVHTPDDLALMDELVSFMKRISKQYDKATFQTSTPNREDTFMGKVAFSNTYLAYWGDEEVKGFIIGCAIDRTLYVLHFCASYSDYISLQNVMQYIVRSVHQKEA